MRRTRAPFAIGAAGPASSGSGNSNRGAKSLVFQAKRPVIGAKPDLNANPSSPKQAAEECSALERTGCDAAGQAEHGRSNEEEEDEEISTGNANNKRIKRPVPFVVPEFTAPRRLITKLAPEVSQRFAQFRLDVERRVLPGGIPCLAFGATGAKAKAKLICCQQSKKEFDFTRFFEHVSLVEMGFIVLDESEWIETGLVRVLKSICDTEAKDIPIGLCASGSVVVKCLEALACLPKDMIACASFIFPVCDFVPIRASQLKALGRLPVYVEVDREDSPFERVLKESGCRLETCLTQQSLQEFLRQTFTNSEATPISENKPHQDGNLPGYRGLESEESEDSWLTDYVVGPAKPSSQSQSQEENDEGDLRAQASETSDLLLVLEPKLSQKGRSIRAYSIHLKREIELLDCELVKVKPGEVLRVSMGDNSLTEEPVYISKLAKWSSLRLDDHARLSVIRYCRKHGVLPKAMGAPSQVSERTHASVNSLSDLLSGSILSKRATFQVRIVDIDVTNFAIVCDDDSLRSLSLRARILLPRPYPGVLHKPDDFTKGDYFELRNVRIDDDHRAALDGFSLRTRMTSLPKSWSVSRKTNVRLVSVKELRSDTYGKGMFRTEGRVTEVVIGGRPFSTLTYSFELPPLMVKASASIKKEFNTLILVLTEKDSEVRILVLAHKVNEVLPFVSADRLVSENLEDRHKEALLCWSLLRALVNEDEKNKVEIGLERKTEDDMLMLLTLDF